LSNPDGCYYKNGEVHCTEERKAEIDAEVGGAPGNGWALQGCFCLDDDCTMTKCSGSECGKFAVFVKSGTCEVIIVPDDGVFCT